MQNSRTIAVPTVRGRNLCATYAPSLGPGCHCRQLQVCPIPGQGTRAGRTLGTSWHCFPDPLCPLEWQFGKDSPKNGLREQSSRKCCDRAWQTLAGHRQENDKRMTRVVRSFNILEHEKLCCRGCGYSKVSFFRNCETEVEQVAAEKFSPTLLLHTFHIFHAADSRSHFVISGKLVH